MYGLAYLFTTDLLEPLLQAAGEPRDAFVRADDLFVTGFLRQRVGAKIIHWDKLYRFDIPQNCKPVIIDPGMFVDKPMTLNDSTKNAIIQLATQEVTRNAANIAKEQSKTTAIANSITAADNEAIAANAAENSEAINPPTNVDALALGGSVKPTKINADDNTRKPIDEQAATSQVDLVDDGDKNAQSQKTTDTNKRDHVAESDVQMEGIKVKPAVQTTSTTAEKQPIKQAKTKSTKSFLVNLTFGKKHHVQINVAAKKPKPFRRKPYNSRLRKRHRRKKWHSRRRMRQKLPHLRDVFKTIYERLHFSLSHVETLGTCYETQRQYMFIHLHKQAAGMVEVWQKVMAREEKGLGSRDKFTHDYTIFPNPSWVCAPFER